MDIEMLTKLFHGYQKTPQLWRNNTVYDISQLPVNLKTKNSFKPKSTSKRLRLGKWAEEFVSFQLKQQDKIEILGESIQIKDGKQTIGELDHIFSYDNEPIHLEVVFKFYLYDPNINDGDTLARWIGPNRRDTLIDKLQKLKFKQLPQLFEAETLAVLDDLGIKPNYINQYVLFKAKLFVPFGSEFNSNLNKECLYGHYINFERLEEFKNHEFYIPMKLEWLREPELKVNWIPFEIAKNMITKTVENKCSPLVWAKSKHEEIQQLFVVWW